MVDTVNVMNIVMHVVDMTNIIDRMNNVDIEVINSRLVCYAYNYHCQNPNSRTTQQQFSLSFVCHTTPPTHPTDRNLR